MASNDSIVNQVLLKQLANILYWAFDLRKSMIHCALTLLLVKFFGDLLDVDVRGLGKILVFQVRLKLLHKLISCHWLV